MKKIVLLLVVALISFSYTYGQDWTEWQHYTTITSGNQRIMDVEYQTYYSRNYYPKIMWRIKNLTSNTYYDVGLGNREYSFANGAKKTNGAEGMKRMEPYETISFIYSSHCCDGDRVTSVNLKYVEFRTERNGEMYRVDIGR